MTELQNYRMTDRTKTICPPIFDLGGIKKSKDMAKPEKSKNQVVPYMDGHLV